MRHFPRSCPRFTFDLHVLGLPPAFVLSQDQTLKFENCSICQVPSLRLVPGLFELKGRHKFARTLKATSDLRRTCFDPDAYLDGAHFWVRTPPPTHLFRSSRCPRTPVFQRVGPKTTKMTARPFRAPRFAPGALRQDAKRDVKPSHFRPPNPRGRVRPGRWAEYDDTKSGLQPGNANYRQLVG